MLCKRIIAKIEVKNSKLVKGINLEGLRVLGNPEIFSEVYFRDGIDEIIYNDVVASLYGRNSILDLIKITASKILVPLTVGGGIRSLKDIYDVLENGADKVCINSAAFENPDLINKAAKIFGSSTVVSALEVSKVNEKHFVFSNNGRDYKGIEVLDWAKKMEQDGAGEILLTSIDRDGTGNGMEIDLINKIADNVEIPVISSGGISNVNHIKTLFQETKSSGVAIASMLHYGYLKQDRIKNIFNSGDIGNLSFLKSNKNFLNFENISIKEIKEYLIRYNIKIRNI